MANEINSVGTAGETRYVILNHPDGRVLYPVTPALETWGTGSRTYDDYDIPLTESDTPGFYKGDVPAGSPVGTYIVSEYLQVGGSPSSSDQLIGSGTVFWDGTREIGLADSFTLLEKASRIRANKASQDKATGTITVRDDDDSADLYTITLTDDGSAITREVGEA